MKRLTLIISLLIFISARAFLQGIKDEQPVLNYVSVDTETGNIEFYWENLDYTDVTYYSIELFCDTCPGTLPIYDFIDSTFNTSVTISSFDTDAKPWSFAIFAFDSNDEKSNPSQRHTTNYLVHQYDSCGYLIELQWSGYIGWGNELSGYDIYFSENEGPVRYAGTTGASLRSFIHTGIRENIQYCYYVAARRNNGMISTSNKICINTDTPAPPEYINADFATVNESNQVELSFTLPPDHPDARYFISRSNNPNMGFLELQEILPESNQMHFIDENASGEQVFYYYVSYVNNCNIEAIKSNIASNILLEGNIQDYQVSLSWTSYYDWLGDVGQYSLYRITGNQPPELVQTFPSAQTSFTDNLEAFINMGYSGDFYYFIIAGEGNNNPHGIRGESQSNRLHILLEPRVYIPNAFTPDGDGRNDYFMPVFTFLPSEYLMCIYDRWGNKIFETTNSQVPWDGSINNNQKAPEGVYGYYIRMKTDSNQIIEKQGTVAIIYP